MDDDGWLSPAQQRAWRHWVALGTALPARLTRQLHEESGLSLADYDVLVALSEAPDARLRVGDLAAAAGWERSRLSHHLRRMGGRDLVAREECADDGRGAWAVLTPTGRDALDRAAPGHVRSVRELVFADLDEAELAVLERVLRGVLERTRG
ncbi:MarR family winged helix-turn-helix transcriptional regulator [Nocardioides dongxiaopingii]|uniref:MarR family winged helix-turn-helix transcriptional regulator n=1 Tax=Nocardioides dongxiaopingii TaxID=2576036 RepID=UPI0010C76FB7|nr:MarR family winged helix-turn-helix transcriptional regulator [Nocardioides dongxiaopingii]